MVERARKVVYLVFDLFVDITQALLVPDMYPGSLMACNPQASSIPIKQTTSVHVAIV